MASTVDEIKQLIYDQIALKPSIAIIATNPSQVAVWKDFVHSLAVCLAAKEQLQDEYLGQINTVIDTAQVGTIPWVRQKAFEFQYDATVPQVIELVEEVPPQIPILIARYPTVDTTKRILSVCTATVNTSRVLTMRVAKGTPPAKLVTSELNSLKGYFNDGGTSSNVGLGVGFAGIAYDIDSLDPDLVWFGGTIYVNGQYAATIKDSIKAALNNYYSTLGANGTLDLLQFIDAIQSVQGVIRIDITNLAVRAAGSSYPAGLAYLINASAITAITADTAAGYAIGETTTGQTFDDLVTISIL